MSDSRRSTARCRGPAAPRREPPRRRRCEHTGELIDPGLHFRRRCHPGRLDGIERDTGVFPKRLVSGSRHRKLPAGIFTNDRTGDHVEQQLTISGASCQWTVHAHHRRRVVEVGEGKRCRTGGGPSPTDGARRARRTRPVPSPSRRCRCRSPTVSSPTPAQQHRRRCCLPVCARDPTDCSSAHTPDCPPGSPSSATGMFVFPSRHRRRRTPRRDRPIGRRAVSLQRFNPR